ncbi:hypothetical protein ACLOJK_019054 [Asimina triloba]
MNDFMEFTQTLKECTAGAHHMVLHLPQSSCRRDPTQVGIDRPIKADRKFGNEAMIEDLLIPHLKHYLRPAEETNPKQQRAARAALFFVSDRQSMAASPLCHGGITVADPTAPKRMLSNPKSVRRSWMRKQKHLDDPIAQMGQLKTDNSQIAKRINAARQHLMKEDSENMILRTQVMELTERLQSLNSVLYAVEEINGLAMDILEIPDPLMRPWQKFIAKKPIPTNLKINGQGQRQIGSTMTDW